MNSGFILFLPHQSDFCFFCHAEENSGACIVPEAPSVLHTDNVYYAYIAMTGNGVNLSDVPEYLISTVSGDDDNVSKNRVFCMAGIYFPVSKSRYNKVTQSSDKCPFPAVFNPEGIRFYTLAKGNRQARQRNFDWRTAIND